MCCYFCEFFSGKIARGYCSCFPSLSDSGRCALVLSPLSQRCSHFRVVIEPPLDLQSYDGDLPFQPCSFSDRSLHCD